METVVVVTPHMLEGLRILRLHHYKGVLHYSDQILTLEASVKILESNPFPDKKTIERKQTLLEKAKSIHSYQMKCVQTLNDFFPIDDNAFNDLLKEKK